MSQEIDGMFICAASFETRCLAGPLALREMGYRAKCAVVFHYDHPDLKDLRERCLDRLASALGELSDKHIQVISCDLYEPHIGLRELLSSRYLRELTESRLPCTLDTSTLTKKHMLMLLKMLEEHGRLPEVFLYTRTANPIYSRLTEGILRVDAIPGFAGSASAHKPTKLLLFLGFEAERALAIWRYYEPSSTVAVLSDIPQTPKWLSHMRASHHALLNSPTVTSVTVRADLPEDTRLLLESDILQSRDLYDVCIAPLGTKAQLLGIYEAVRIFPEVQVGYCPPHRYLPNYPRRGVGSTVFLRRECAPETNAFRYRLYYQTRVEIPDEA